MFSSLSTFHFNIEFFKFQTPANSPLMFYKWKFGNVLRSIQRFSLARQILSLAAFEKFLVSRRRTEAKIRSATEVWAFGSVQFKTVDEISHMLAIAPTQIKKSYLHRNLVPEARKNPCFTRPMPHWK